MVRYKSEAFTHQQTTISVVSNKVESMMKILRRKLEKVIFAFANKTGGGGVVPGATLLLKKHGYFLLEKTKRKFQ